MMFSQDPFDVFFFSIGTIFALLAVWAGYRSPDRASRLLNRAQDEWNREADEIEHLHAERAYLLAEYGQTYLKHRAEAIQIQKQGLELMGIYAEALSQHSRFGRIEMLLPLIDMPPSLEAAEPPPLKFWAAQEVK